MYFELYKRITQIFQKIIRRGEKNEENTISYKI